MSVACCCHAAGDGGGAGCDRRKSPAWFGLLRKHAELAVQDVTYFATMKENCKADTMINKK